MVIYLWSSVLKDVWNDEHLLWLLSSRDRNVYRLLLSSGTTFCIVRGGGERVLEQFYYLVTEFLRKLRIEQPEGKEDNVVFEIDRRLYSR